MSQYPCGNELCMDKYILQELILEVLVGTRVQLSSVSTTVRVRVLLERISAFAGLFYIDSCELENFIVLCSERKLTHSLSNEICWSSLLAKVGLLHDR